VFAGAQIEPDDVDGADPDPVTSARVRLDDASGSWAYRAAFLAPGDYTLALTCDAVADDPATDDAGIGFPASGQASVVSDQESVLDFTG
jgi:hypothetical protein